MKDMELMSVTPAIGSGRARAGSDIIICGVIVGGSLGGQQTIEGALPPCRAWSTLREEGEQVHGARRRL